ncbi:MAG: DUF6573 family protein [Acidobacteriaceae bacterium]
MNTNHRKRTPETQVNVEGTQGLRNPQGVTPLFGGLLSLFTRAQAIKDGLLVDVTIRAREAGWRGNEVALTRAVWEDCVAWTDADSRRQTYQDETGRLLDVLGMAWIAGHRHRGGCFFSLHRVPRGGRRVRPREVELKLVCEAEGACKPEITIMMPSED